MAGSRSGSPVKSSPKKKKARKPSAPKAHPAVADMVCQAIRELKDRKGSSGMAIKKYVLAHYKVNNAILPHIKRFLRTGATSGRLVQKSGTGASGRFRVGKTAAPKKKKKAKKPKKKAAKRKPKRKPKAKKAAKAKSSKKPKAAKKAKAGKKKAAPKSKPAAAKAKKPKAAKKTAKKAARPKKAKKSAKK